MENQIKEHIEMIDGIDVLTQSSIKNIARLIKHSVNHLNGKVIIMGNGGSAADAQHFTAELVCTYKKERKALPAICLNTNTSVLTAWSNDFSFDTVFKRQIEALANKDDMVIGISTSGNSVNVYSALKEAKERGCITVGLTGKKGGKLKKVSNILINVQSKNTPRIQEAHIFIIHCICGYVDEFMK